MLKSIKNVKNKESVPIGLDNIFVSIDRALISDEIWNVVFDYIQSFGFNALTYYHMPPAGSRDFDNHYFSLRGKNVNPFIVNKAALFDANRSFIHTSKRCDKPTLFKQTSHFDYLSEEQLNLFKTLHALDTLSGIVFPVHGSNGRSGCFVLEATNTEKTLTQQDIRQLHWVCQSAHQAYCLIRRRNNKVIKQLTNREKQILTWVARGKSNSVIADIIGISQHTVNGYLRSIYLKTGTSDRTTAALRGVGERLIDL